LFVLAGHVVIGTRHICRTGPQVQDASGDNEGFLIFSSSAISASAPTIAAPPNWGRDIRVDPQQQA
jgi:hypothetical protein